MDVLGQCFKPFPPANRLVLSSALTLALIQPHRCVLTDLPPKCQLFQLTVFPNLDLVDQEFRPFMLWVGFRLIPVLCESTLRP